MSHLERQPRAPRAAHVLPRDEFERLAGQAWDVTFVPAMAPTPHPDNDPDLVGWANGQRRHAQMMLGALAGVVADRCVAAGLYPNVEAFFEDSASDPATAGVARASGGDA